MFLMRFDVLKRVFEACVSIFCSAGSASMSLYIEKGLLDPCFSHNLVFLKQVMSGLDKFSTSLSVFTSFKQSHFVLTCCEVKPRSRIHTLCRIKG